MIEQLTPLPAAILALGLFAGGTPVLLAAMYLAVAGSLNITVLFALAITTTLLWDSIWYVLGRVIPKNNLRHLPLLAKHGPLLSRLELFYRQRRYPLVFGSRFIYGTNSMLSVLSGIYKMPFIAFIGTCTLSICAWFFALYALSNELNIGLPALGVFGTEVILPIFLILTFAVTLAVKKILRHLLIN